MSTLGQSLTFASLPSPLLGGVGLALSAQSLLALNGRVFGISGFLHRAARGSHEGIIAVAGLVLSGFVIGQLEGIAPPVLASADLSRMVLSGLLVGLGTKLANGCTSGHMLCGVPRLSPRSLAATATFFATGVATARILHGSDFATDSLPSLNINSNDIILLAGSALGLAASWIIPHPPPCEERKDDARRQNLVQFLTPFSFGLSLRVSKLVDPNRVIGFLLLPFHSAFDPALLYLAVGALPLLALLYRATTRKITTAGRIDARLIGGAALFGVGWGMAGICPGPGLVNLGQGLATGARIGTFAAWLGAVVTGGFLGGYC